MKRKSMLLFNYTTTTMLDSVHPDYRQAASDHITRVLKLIKASTLSTTELALIISQYPQKD